MEFGWGSEDGELYDGILAFAKGALGTPAHEFDRARWDALAAHGLAGVSVPEAYGGLGLGALRTCRAYEALGRGTADLGLAFSAAAHLFAVTMPIVEVGSESLKSRYLPDLAAGRKIGANAITEPGAGSDVNALKARALKDGDSYVISGDKSYVTNGPVADVFLVYASTNPAHGFMGISAFVVEKGALGLTVGKPFEKTGLHGSPCGPVYLDGVRVPESARVGAEGGGGVLFQRSMQWERACLFALYVGAMERQLAQCVAFAKERKQFGKSIGKHQAVAHRIVDMSVRLESARLVLYRACWKADQGQDATAEISMAKLVVSEAAVQNGLDAVRVHGGLGVMAESNVANGINDALPATIFSGTSDMQRNIIAARLGL